MGPTGSNSGGATEAAVLGRRRHQYIASPPPFPIFNQKMVGGFTCEQWKELERQATIYRYMISCLPVPPPLLYTMCNAVVLEPAGRCKRTDGKKWRCSRDAEPHQKYCERHLHRGRPRSRKPVEQLLQNAKQKKPRLSYHRDLGSTMLAANEADRTYSDFPTDAWSDCYNVGHESFSPSLSLSIGEMGNAQECDGGVGFYAGCTPVCWGAFGGPLAEALCANPPRDSIGGAFGSTYSEDVVFALGW